MVKYEDDKPPPAKDNLRKPIAAGIYISSDDGSIAGRRKMAFIQHLSSPDPKFRLRNDCIVLDSIRQGC